MSFKKFDKLIDTAYRLKLLAMGFVPGAQFQVIRKAPLGDMIQITIQGAAVSLRSQELALLHVRESLS